jgi:hypothetical protein
MNPDDQMQRPIGSLVWAYANLLKRKDIRQSRPDIPYPPDYLEKERQMELAYRIATELRWEELAAYMQRMNVKLVNDGEPVPLNGNTVLLFGGLVCVLIERNRVGDDVFFGDGLYPPPPVGRT